MKKLLIILLSVLSLTAFAQEKKTVAVLDPICRDNSVNAFFQQMVRGAMESAVTASDEYEAYDRSAFDMIQKEQAFQRTGAVNDSQIKKMGELAGVDYVLVSEVSAYEGYLSAIVKILNVTTGKYDKSVDDYSQLTPEAVKKKCNEMASSLFGSLRSSSSSRPVNSTNTARGNDLTQGKSTTTNIQVTALSNKSTISAAKTQNDISTLHQGNEYVDLGLPSGTLWKAENENCGLITHEKAVALYNNNLPTKEQFQELTTICTWTWMGNGYLVKGPNNNSIFLQADKGLKKTAFWSSTLIDIESYSIPGLSKKDMEAMRSILIASGGIASCLILTSKKIELSGMIRSTPLNIRLVR